MHKKLDKISPIFAKVLIFSLKCSIMISVEIYIHIGGRDFMHVDLISTTKGSPKVVHATENSKKTACGINLTKPENIGQFAAAGELSDVIQITCEKCKTIIAKKLIKESNREMAAA